MKINASSKYTEMTIGGNIQEPGNSREFNTGDWRSGKKPVWIIEKCKQCLFCIPCCPDDAIHTDKTTQKMIGFDYDKCKGCGICPKACPFGAIDWKSE